MNRKLESFIIILIMLVTALAGVVVHKTYNIDRLKQENIRLEEQLQTGFDEAIELGEVIGMSFPHWDESVANRIARLEDIRKLACRVFSDTTLSRLQKISTVSNKGNEIWRLK